MVLLRERAPKFFALLVGVWHTELWTNVSLFPKLMRGVFTACVVLCFFSSILSTPNLESLYARMIHINCAGFSSTGCR